MLCVRCMSRALPPLKSPSSSPALRLKPLLGQSRTFSALSGIPSRPKAPAHPVSSLQQDVPSTTSFAPSSQPSMLQIRGAKRDTFNPSHVVRKRRLGFLARLRSRTGRAILKRRRAKRRVSLTH